MCCAIYLANDKMLLENRIFSFLQILPSEFLTFDSSDLSSMIYSTEMGSHYYLLSFEENLSHEHVISAVFHYIGWCRVTPQRHPR